MKKYIVLPIFVFLLACTPERITNNKLEGNWSLDPATNSNSNQKSLKYIFQKNGRSEGDLLIEYTDSLDFQNTLSTWYSIYKSSSITVVFSKEPDYKYTEYEIVKLDKDSLVLADKTNLSKVLRFKKN